MNQQCHFVDCAVNKNASNPLPNCSIKRTCGISCILLWLSHLDECTRCVCHIINEDCTNLHCHKVYETWKLKGEIIEYLRENKLPVEGCTFHQVLGRLKTILQLDFEHLRYEPLSDTKENVQHSTRLVFSLLQILKRYNYKMREYGNSMDGVDLSGVLDYICDQLQK